MPISWNEIRQNAIAFARDWKTETREEAEAKTFWDEFFKVFGIKRRTVASFEEPVKKLSGSWGFIDLFWPGKLLVEHKSRGKSLEKAESQAMAYIHGLKNAKRDDEIPRYIIVSDFARVALHDLEDDSTVSFPLGDFHKRIDKFAFIPGYKQHNLEAEDPVNIEAVERLGGLHDALKEGGYGGHDLEQFLVRILFCLFAEDTGIFEVSAFSLSIENHTREDGSDLGPHLARVFQVLNTPKDKRQKNLIDDLAVLEYVNGHLFAEPLAFADFNRKMRDELLHCGRFDWSQISPAVFGSLFQSVMESKDRRQAGAHYTSERDILKVVRSLFLDDLRAEFEKAKGNATRLKAFHEKLGRLTFFDPACGCGNFLVVTYRELRLLELDVLQEILKGQRVIDVALLSLVDVDAMHGIEINEFPARIAEVALWLVDHQMNLRLSEAFGEYFVRLPLRKSAKIVHANALRIDWATVIAPEKCSYVLGNPPFVGSKYQDPDQRADMELVTRGIRNAGVLDFVTAWYFKAADFIRGTETPVAFVSTNSITQGEQVGILWGELFRRGMRLRFAHRTFVWKSEARGRAHVHVVIIGFGTREADTKALFDYDNDPDNPTVTAAKNISPYLVEGPDAVLVSRSTPLCNVPPMISGNQPLDNGNYFFTPEEKAAFERQEPMSTRYFRLWLGGEEFINGIERWCLWLGDVEPSDLRKMPLALQRVEAVKAFRLKSKRGLTLKYAQTPTRFGVEVFSDGAFLAFPQVSSERRNFIPIAYLLPEIMVGEKLRLIANATVWHFGILTSTMHMAWMRRVTGRLKSDYQYSGKLVYNNYPWPDSPSDKQKAAVEAKAQAVLDARSVHASSSFADLYDPLTMPPNLAKAHAELDRAVELCYRPKPFATDRERVEFLFDLYERLASPLTAQMAPKKGRRKKTDDATNDE